MLRIQPVLTNNYSKIWCQIGMMTNVFFPPWHKTMNKNDIDNFTIVNALWSWYVVWSLLLMLSCVGGGWRWNTPPPHTWSQKIRHPSLCFGILSHCVSYCEYHHWLWNSQTIKSRNKTIKNINFASNIPKNLPKLLICTGTVFAFSIHLQHELIL